MGKQGLKELAPSHEAHKIGEAYSVRESSAPLRED
jgi:hypothetical protein